ncbi:hypothetical protein [Nitrosomonas communis]|uniref:Uncharacterized protein n=1 Tax=Nitrosomonas communis TaxID=44574 RepID=A0A1I4RPF2_9PROT|nr:hypothetical protein [Nitrosomonas communis]SFM54142.1 hypothetical protein SAMN05421863_103427 [Nitrosomonas communis]
MSEISTARQTRLLALYRRQGTSCQELIHAYKNANNENDKDFADEIADILDERYPNWNVSCISKLSSMQNDQLTINVTFADQSKSFPSAKQAYIWLVEKILNNKPDKDIDDYVLNSMFIRGSHGARYLARNPAELFPRDPNRAKDSNCYHKLSNGWFLNTNLSNKQKRDKLLNLTAVYEAYDSNWTWLAEEESYGSQVILDELDKILKEL